MFRSVSGVPSAVAEQRDRQQVVAHGKLAAREDGPGRDRELMVAVLVLALPHRCRAR